MRFAGGHLRWLPIYCFDLRSSLRPSRTLWVIYLLVATAGSDSHQMCFPLSCRAPAVEGSCAATKDSSSGQAVACLVAPCAMPDVCLNGGACVDDPQEPHAFRCTCAGGYNGTRCETLIAPCFQAGYCGSYGSCVDTRPCGTSCNEHTYECFLAELHGACCADGNNCPASSDVPLTCPSECAAVFPDFLQTCRGHLESLLGAADIAEFDTFEQECAGGPPPPPPPSGGGGHRRHRLQTDDDRWVCECTDGYSGSRCENGGGGH
eukprot:SAG22_NODE_1804_length_3533_cov_8.437775_2_plen_263_part_00